MTFPNDKASELAWKLFPEPVPISLPPNGAIQSFTFEGTFEIKTQHQIVCEAAVAIHDAVAPLMDEFEKMQRFLCIEKCDGIPSDSDEMHTEDCRLRRGLLAGWKL
jgi:hypothetical protein